MFERVLWGIRDEVGVWHAFGTWCDMCSFQVLASAEGVARPTVRVAFGVQVACGYKS